MLAVHYYHVKLRSKITRLLGELTCRDDCHLVHVVLLDSETRVMLHFRTSNRGRWTVPLRLDKLFFFSVHGDNVDTAIPRLADDACLPAEILPHIAYKTLERLRIHLLE